MEPRPPRYAEIIEAYLARKLSLPAAAQQLVEALDAAGPVNFTISPQMRPLLAEVERLRTGRAPEHLPPFAPDPDRHKDGNLDLLDGVEAHFWETLAKYDHPTRLDCSFHAETERSADRIANWLKGQGHSVRVQTPAEANKDDWVVRATSPSTRWPPLLLAEWAQLLRSAPLGGSASLRGVGVLQS